jgi:F0F1-type ATP synthase assembly protein I
MSELEYEKAMSKAVTRVALSVGVAMGGAIAWGLDSFAETGPLWLVPLSGLAVSVAALIAGAVSISKQTKGPGSG